MSILHCMFLLIKQQKKIDEFLLTFIILVAYFLLLAIIFIIITKYNFDIMKKLNNYGQKFTAMYIKNN